MILARLITGDKSGNTIYHSTDKCRNIHLIGDPKMGETVVLSLQVQLSVIHCKRPLSVQCRLILYSS